MKIITTPMCEDILRIAGLTDFEVVKPTKIKNADCAVLLSETKSDVPKIAIKLNSYEQVYKSVLKIKNKFNTTPDEKCLDILLELIESNNKKRKERKHIKVKVYSNFLKESVENLGYTITKDNYDYVIAPDFMEQNLNEENIIIIPSHNNVEKNVIKRIKERYKLLENELCTKQ